MATTIPENFKRLLEEPVFPKLATLMPDGRPQVHPVWADYDGHSIRINTIKGRQKDKNLRQRDQATLLFVDPENPYYWMEVRGHVADMVEGPEAKQHIDDLAKKYMGQDEFPGHQEHHVRVMYRIEPDRIVTQGDEE